MFYLQRLSILAAGLSVLASGCGDSQPAAPAGNSGAQAASTDGPTSGSTEATGASSTTTGSTSTAGGPGGVTGSTATGSSGVGGAASGSTTDGGANNSVTSTSGVNSVTGAGGAATTSATIDGTTTTGAGGTNATADPGCGSHKWACWPMPNMPGSGLPNEASYTDNGDGTVTDNLTLLIWQAEQPDQNYGWQDAIDYCDGLSLAGHDDWRMPTRIEITSVLDHSDSHTGWSSAAFPGARGGFHHSGSDWILTITQTGAGAGNDYAWAFNMSDGILSNAYSKANTTPVRCVRGGGSGEAPSEPAVAPPDQYTIVAEGEAQDNYTGLIWQQGDSDSMLSWQDAVDYCASLGLNGNSWRLPSIRELATLVDEAEVAPSINSEMFPDTHYGARSDNWYWATPERGSAAWGLNFDDGFTGTNTGSAAWNTFGPSWARCVR